MAKSTRPESDYTRLARAELGDIADFAAGLDPEEAAAQSPCTEWSVGDVLAQVCSNATVSAGPGTRGIRTSRSSPRRNSWLSVPAGGRRTSGSDAHSGSWSASNRRTVSSSMVISSACIAVIASDCSTGQ